MTAPRIPASGSLRVLVADDDAMARLGYRAMLEGAGHTVSLAQDGEEALRLMDQGSVDILLLDILMPRKEGLETLLEAKRRFPLLAIIAMSAGGVRSDLDFLALAAKFGADRTLRKPFNRQALMAVLDELNPAGGAQPGIGLAQRA